MVICRDQNKKIKDAKKAKIRKIQENPSKDNKIPINLNQFLTYIADRNE